MITDEVIDVLGNVVVSVNPTYTYLHTDEGDFVIGSRPSNIEVYHGATLRGRARIWKGCAWDGELVSWEMQD